MAEASVAEKEKEAPKAEKAKEAPVEKKEKKEKVPTVIVVKSTKANPKAPIDPRTGTRFQPNSARQLGFDVVFKNAKAGKNIKEIRDILKATRKDKGASFDLDVGYLNFTCASHPEMFECWTDGKVVVKQDPKPDPEAAKKFDEERNAKKVKAQKARDERKTKADAPKVEKSEKVVKAEKKDDGDKPSKKEKEA